MKLWRILALSAFLVAFYQNSLFCEENKEKDPFTLLTEERIGTLYVGMPEAEVKKAISCRASRGREILEHATGEWVAEWKYPDCGIILKMASEKKRAPKSVSSITVSHPCTLATKQGIRIGSTEEEVLKSYGQYQDEESLLFSTKGEQFVAGSIYGGMIFTFKKGRVTGIFLGAAAE